MIEGPNDKGRWEVQVPLGASLGGVFFGSLGVVGVSDGF